MEISSLLRQDNEVVAVEMYRMGDSHETPLTRGDLLGGSLCGDDEVNPGVFLMGLIYDSVFIGVPGEVVDVVDGGIAEFEPHGRIEDVPPAEVAVGDGVVR